MRFLESYDPSDSRTTTAVHADLITVRCTARFIVAVAEQVFRAKLTLGSSRLTVLGYNRRD